MSHNKIILATDAKSTIPTLNNVNDNLAVPSLEIKTIYNNSTRLDLILCRRDNIKLPLLRGSSRIIDTNSQYFNSLLIREVIKITGKDAISNIRHYLTSLINLNIDLNNFRDSFFKVGTQNNITIVLDYIISEDVIKKNENIYLINKDLLISTDEINSVPLHPYSTEQLEIESINTFADKYLKDIDPNSFMLSLQIVDHEDLTNNKYINIAGKVYKLNKSKVINKPSGIYLTIKNDQNDIIYDKYDLIKGLEELSIYNNQEEALHFNNSDINKKIELEKTKQATLELEQNNRILNAANARIESQSKTKQLELEAELEALKHSAKTIENENNILKAKYEQEKLKLERELLEIKTKIETENIQLKQQTEEQKHKYEQDKIKANSEYVELKSEYEKIKAQLQTQQTIMNGYYDARKSDRSDSSDLFKYISSGMAAVLGIALIYTKATANK